MSEPTPFRQRAAAAIADERLVRAVHLTTLKKVAQRQDALTELGDADALRQLARRIKRHTLDNLPDFLRQFSEQVERAGGVVHHAADAAAARRIIVDIARRHEATRVVKAKSMTTEEVGLNDALAACGMHCVETDLGEFIVQLDRDRPSHIVSPIIHKNRRQIAATMARELGCEYTEDAVKLTRIARGHLREAFRRCELGITGVNFGVAETGTLCLLTNEGNARMTVSRPRVHVALMGIEKLVPRLVDLAVFLKLISRSVTGQKLGSYTTLITGPRRGSDADGPEALHVVLLDNGRSEILASEFRDVLSCIRCGACLNACPVYRNIGGHAYASVYPGPIGSLVTPLMAGLRQHADLPRASSLCGACRVACPVDLDIPHFLQRLRERMCKLQPMSKRIGMTLWSLAMRSPATYSAGQRMLRAWLAAGGRAWHTDGIGAAARLDAATRLADAAAGELSEPLARTERRVSGPGARA